MPKKLTLEDVKKYLEENDKENLCSLLSDTYINSDTPLLFRCNVCGNTFERDYHHLKRGRFSCSSCANKNQKKSNKLTIEDIQNYIKHNDLNHECLLLSTTYINSTTPLKFKCNICGDTFERDVNHLFRKRFRCPRCGRRAGASKLEYTKQDVIDTIEDEGLIIIGNYINASTGVKCQCSKGHIFDLYFSEYLQRGRSCPKCAIEKISGKNHWNYNGGGHQETMDMLRHAIIPWKYACFKKNNKCDITNSKFDLVVHHLKDFADIVKEASFLTGVPIYNKVEDYSFEERERLTQKVIELHTIEIGVVLTRDLHNKFHSIYGKKNNTKKQYQEFKEKYQQGLIK